MRAARPEEAVRFEVLALRDGRRLASRRIEVFQEDRRVGEFSASFTSQTEGVALGRRDGAVVDVPGPDEIQPREQLATEEGIELMPHRPIDLRFIEQPWRRADRAYWRAWAKPARPAQRRRRGRLDPKTGPRSRLHGGGYPSTWTWVAREFVLSESQQPPASSSPRAAAFRWYRQGSEGSVRNACRCS